MQRPLTVVGFLWLSLLAPTALADDVRRDPGAAGGRVRRVHRRLGVDGFIAQQPDGSFADIDYASRSRTSWPPVTHLQRLKAMAAALPQGWRSVAELPCSGGAAREEIVPRHPQSRRARPPEVRSFGRAASRTAAPR